MRRLSAFPAETLSLSERGRLREGAFADVVVFDLKKLQDHATYEAPHQLSTGVENIWINGERALKDSVATGAPSGRVVRGRAWTGANHGGCRASSTEWTWTK